jgi:CBS domain-containing protein
MKARDVMQWNPTVVTADESVSHAAEQMRYERDACIPVVQDTRSWQLVGVITARDLATRCMARGHGQGCTVADHMTPLPLHTVALDDDVQGLLRVMHDFEIRRLPVVDRDNSLCGMLTEHDLAESLTAADWLARTAVDDRHSTATRTGKAP